ncbi:nucleotide-diphospho-sugar transferase [Pontibacter populi]|uniref:Nucleotide-diphospho-sugar transferase n=1 Tax=Pontibacter populi TaxID=890055 RepID=A0ABV1RVA2_9BACT
MFETPILFIVFNRPQKTQQVFEKIREIKPTKLYVAADGPRLNNNQDALFCEEVRSLIKVDWDCSLVIKYRDNNAGCKINVSEAITWFFQNEEYGIILEDDCLPDTSFFSYCENLLHRYKDDDKVFSISGCNFGYSAKGSDDYFFSPIFNMWGWATWRRSSDLVDYNLNDWKSLTYLEKLFFIVRKLGRPYHINFDWGWFQYWINILNNVAKGDLDTWDYQWAYAQMKWGQLTIFPEINLIENLGFDLDATHTKSTNKYRKFTSNQYTGLQNPTFKPKLDFDFYDFYQKKVWAYYHRQPFLFHLKNYLLKACGIYGK